MKLIEPFDPSIGSGVIHTNGINKNEQLVLYNDSLYGLKLTFADNSIDVIPPSWNKDFILPNIPMGDVQWTIYNQIVATGYPMSQVYGPIYEPGEHVGRVNAGMQRGFTLTGGSVNTSNTSLSNEGNPIGTQIIDIGTPTNTLLWDIFNDHFTISIEKSGVKHLIFVGSLTGNPLQVGQVGDITEFLGNMLINGTLESVGNATLDGTLGVTGNTLLSTLNISGITTIGDKITGGTTADVKLDAATGKTVFIKNNGVNILGIDGSNVSLQGSYGFQLGAGGVYRFRHGATMQDWGSFNANGSGTYTHGLGFSPFMCIPIVNVVGSATQGYDSATTTTVHITLGASISAKVIGWS